MDRSVEDSLVAAAQAVAAHAHAPYSKFAVGAALLGSDGSVYVGCNVENASFGATQCAERSAVGAMVAAGVRELSAVAVFTDTSEPTLPCGICRQVLREFAEDAVVICATPSGRVQHQLSELLPYAFSFEG
ncbi:MAG: cytidine deaminase [Polyangiaceae bacterium]|nr:cytidine deaminase [Polyangiaceae bacterium]